MRLGSGHRWATVTAAVLVAVLTVAGCDDGFGAAEEPVPTPEPGEAPSPDGTREDDAATDGADGPLSDTDPAVDRCDDDEFAAVDGTVGDQLDAFAEDDWEQAYSLASREYRQGVDLEEFVLLIEEHFPAVADPAGHTSAECLTDGTRASIVVTVTGRADGSRTYLYLLTLEDDGWRVNGATPSATPEPGGV